MNQLPFIRWKSSFDFIDDRFVTSVPFSLTLLLLMIYKVLVVTVTYFSTPVSVKLLYGGLDFLHVETRCHLLLEAA